MTKAEAMRAAQLRRDAAEYEARAHSSYRTIATIMFEAQRALAEAAELRAQARAIETKRGQGA